ncbi:hypothetical protein YE105_C3322 [Yersinia enterocolitica subsp. palearctica 105.5R(r)]|uniref:Uncharacterized protein n=2 Tax=Yersinia enterocolitica TaxID=630 RepID=A0A0H3NKT9_YERE1|nr:hypothetical protein YE105_C3322 [Yersinia enterocolitica subsp. palearctica 105.5R(r)]CBX72468.1 unknown protein [Yersinia enterocolitica W22703]CBY25732.1 hypothetical protein Y11_24491 [Yersinia enterocolitica subsp. palearctica Y11]CCO70103.1 hypothetical protein D322_3246 [Yersinia enterocolitica IP 10393]
MGLRLLFKDVEEYVYIIFDIRKYDSTIMFVVQLNYTKVFY